MIGQKYHFTVKTVKELLGRAGGGGQGILHLCQISLKNNFCATLLVILLLLF